MINQYQKAETTSNFTLSTSKILLYIYILFGAYLSWEIDTIWLMKSFLQVFNSKKNNHIIFINYFHSYGFSVPSYAEETEQWEKDLTTCINQKAASIHVSLDVSGSTEFTDPNGVSAATVAISLGLQKLLKNFSLVSMRMLIWKYMAHFLHLEMLFFHGQIYQQVTTKQQLDSEKILLNKSDGGTSYLETHVVDTLFNTKKFRIRVKF